MTMTVLVTGDLHLSDNARDKYRHDFMVKLPALARKQRADLILILGDLTEEKDRFAAELVNAVVDHLHALARVAPVIVLQGNHDYLNIESPFFAFLARLEGLTWVNRPTALNSLENVPATVSRALGKAILCPHTSNCLKDWAKIDFKGYNWAFMHQTFTGAVSETGFKLSGIPLNYFPKNLQIISGDIHRPQELGNLTYCGAPFLVDFGDQGISRMLLIDASGKLKSLPCAGPQKRLVTVGSIKELAKQPQLNENDVLKVRVEIEPGDYPRWPEMVEQVKAWGADNGFLIHLVQPVVQATSRSMISQRTAAPSKTDEQLLKDYAKHRGVDENTVKAGLKLLDGI